MTRAFSEQTDAGNITAAYVHIPFCRRRCYYCDFPISVVGDRRNGSNSSAIADYIDVVCQEIQRTPSSNHPLSSIFFGGGTPSLLTVAQVSQVLETLNHHFGIAAAAEISMEIDPGTFNLEQVQGYKTVGINRASLGVQAFQPNLLQVCGRSHQVEDIYTAVDQLRQADFANFSLDLISGLPGQTLQHWQQSLASAIALAPTHLSCYDLTIEPGTPFSRQYKPGATPLPSDDTTAEMYRTAQHVLTQAGFEHYEISNYARPGYQCRHNRVYWDNRPFYGFGMGATSYVGGDRVARPRKTREYYEWVKLQAGRQTNWQTDRGDRLLDTLMLGLRLSDGVSCGKLAAEFGDDILERLWKCLKPYQQKGLVEVLNTQSTDPLSRRIRLSDPEGFLLSNMILVKLFEEFG